MGKNYPLGLPAATASTDRPIKFLNEPSGRSEAPRRAVCEPTQLVAIKVISFDWRPKPAAAEAGRDKLMIAAGRPKGRWPSRALISGASPPSPPSPPPPPPPQLLSGAARRHSAGEADSDSIGLRDLRD